MLRFGSCLFVSLPPQGPPSEKPQLPPALSPPLRKLGLPYANGGQPLPRAPPDQPQNSAGPVAPLVPLNLGPRGPLLVAQNRPVAKHAPKNNGKDRPWQSEFPRDSPVQGTSVPPIAALACSCCETIFYTLQVQQLYHETKQYLEQRLFIDSGVLPYVLL